MSSFGKFKMDRTEAPVDKVLEEQENVVVEREFSHHYDPKTDVYQQVIKGNQANSVSANMRRPSTFALKMKKEISGITNKDQALQDDMWDFEDEEVDINGKQGHVSFFPLEVQGYHEEDKKFLDPFYVNFKFMDKVSMISRSEVERIIVANVNYNEEEKKLNFDSSTFINMSKLLEVKATRRAYTTSYSKLITPEGKVVLLRFRMPRF
jgi:hypothetical protein